MSSGSWQRGTRRNRVASSTPSCQLARSFDLKSAVRRLLDILASFSNLPDRVAAATRRMAKYKSKQMGRQSKSDRLSRY